MRHVQKPCLSIRKKPVPINIHRDVNYYHYLREKKRLLEFS